MDLSERVIERVKLAGGWRRASAPASLVISGLRAPAGLSSRAAAVGSCVRLTQRRGSLGRTTRTHGPPRPGDERELCCCRARSPDLKDLNDLCEIRPSPTKYRFVRGAQQDDSPVQDRTGLSNHNQLSSAGPPSCWRNPGLHLARCRRGRTLSSVLCNSFSHHARCRRRAADHGRHATLDAVLPRARGPHRPVRVIERVKLACN